MQTIRLRVNDRIYKSLVKALSKFSTDDIEVIVEDENYISVQKYLERELLSVEDGSAEYIDLPELEKSLEDTIRKYEA